MDIIINNLQEELSDEQPGYLSIMADSNDLPALNIKSDELVPVLPLRNTVMFPNIVMPIAVSRNKSLRLIR